jgi:glycosyltransferase involved in cell wall biosynthesis
VRIAQIAPPWFTVPPSGYGGIELVVSLLADGLVGRGHDVVLFAPAGSETKAELRCVNADHPNPSLLGNVWSEAEHAFAVYADLQERGWDGVELVHDHSGVIGPALGALVDGPPVVHTLHGQWIEPARRYFALLDRRVHLIAVSESQRAANPDATYAGVVPNGIDLAAYTFRDRKDDFLLFIGRANPDKGPALAIEIARRAERPLVMIVKRNEPFERAYWDEVVAPLLHDGVEVLESVAHAQKVDLLARARALVFPIQWPEPFGLVMTEAMACGTPVIAHPAGAAVELVVDGVTGFLRESTDGLVACVERTTELDPEACRARVAEHFSAQTMVEGYERIYDAVCRSHAAHT